MDGLGKEFWLKLFGSVLVLGLGLFVVLLLLDLLAWGLGLLGGLVVVLAILFLIAWRYDKRQQTSHRAE